MSVNVQGRHDVGSNYTTSARYCSDCVTADWRAGTSCRINTLTVSITSHVPCEGTEEMVVGVGVVRWSDINELKDTGSEQRVLPGDREKEPES